MTVCCWCKFRTVNGHRTETKLDGLAYASAQHGMCIECADRFEADTVNLSAPATQDKQKQVR